MNEEKKLKIGLLLFVWLLLTAIVMTWIVKLA